MSFFRDDIDTIAAISTAPGRAALAVVRLSGPDALKIAGKMVEGSLPSPGTFAHRKIKDASGRVIDDALVLSFASPKSYTGEDAIEFQCHGGDITPSRVLAACIACGARLADRGEFTYRAVMAGKIDLDKAESILDLINAKTAEAADDAIAGIAGRRNEDMVRLYKTAVGISSELEHSLDIDEGELPDSFIADMDAKTAAFKKELEKAFESERKAKLFRDGVVVALSGPPNSGKSSLMNALLGEDRAIVSPEAGTTRDAVDSWLDVDGFPVRLVDTAGLREAASSIEAEGVRRARNIVRDADIVLALDPDPCARPGASASGESKILHIHSKCDLSRGEGLNVSSVTGEGLGDLRKELSRRIAKLERTDDSRHAGAYAFALAELERDGENPDVVIRANTMRRIGETLAAAVGAFYTDDMFENLFSRFCVGK